MCACGVCMCEHDVSRFFLVVVVVRACACVWGSSVPIHQLKSYLATLRLGHTSRAVEYSPSEQITLQAYFTPHKGN